MAKKVKLNVKCELLLHYLENKLTVSQLLRYAEEKYDLKVSRQSIGKWISQKDEIIASQNIIDKTQFYGKKHKEKVRIPNPVDLAFEEEIHLIMVEKYSNDEKITRLLITSTAEELQTARNMKRGFGRRRLESFLDRFGYSYQPRAQTLVPSNVTDYVIDKSKNDQTSEVECEIVELIDGPKTEPVDDFEVEL